MTRLSPEIAISALGELFAEAYEGPQHGYTWFNDCRPGSGVLGRIAPLSSTQASLSLTGGPTIASHVEHLRWMLEQSNAEFRGLPTDPDWKNSWLVHSVDETGWLHLQSCLRDEYEQTRSAIAQQADWTPSADSDEDVDPHRDFRYVGTLALLPHAAYHLGIIAEMVRHIETL